MRRWLAFVILPMALLGCAEGEDLSGDVEVISAEPTPPQSAANELPPLSEPAPCGVVLNVGAEWLETAKAQAARWTAAAGCTVTYGPEGAPVSFPASMTDHDGEPVFGKTVISILDGKFERCISIDVSLESDDPARTFGHELGHCLGARGHTIDGLMRDYHRSGDSAAIDGSALELLCSSVSCSKFVPEAPTFDAEPEEM